MSIFDLIDTQAQQTFCRERAMIHFCSINLERSCTIFEGLCASTSTELALMSLSIQILLSSASKVSFSTHQSLSKGSSLIFACLEYLSVAFYIQGCSFQFR